MENRAASTSSRDPEYHGQDIKAAVARATEINGYVVWSFAPHHKDRSEATEWGYWSDPDCMIRNWERLVWSSDFSAARNVRALRYQAERAARRV